MPFPVIFEAVDAMAARLASQLDMMPHTLRFLDMPTPPAHFPIAAVDESHDAA